MLIVPRRLLKMRHGDSPRTGAGRKNGQLIAKLTAEFEARRREVVEPLLGRLNRRKLTAKERQDVEAAFRLYQNKLLHAPITALGDATKRRRRWVCVAGGRPPLVST